MEDFGNILRPKENKLKPAQGRLLISEPFMNDFFFGRSVILLAEHNNKGSFGVVINKPVGYRINDLTSEFPDFDVPVFLGGPVNTNNIFFIHSLGYTIPGSQKIIGDIFWGGDVEIISQMIKNNIVTPDDIRFFVGYSGWGKNQLEQELKQNSWIIVKSKKDFIMNRDPNNLWKNLVLNLGKDFEIWTKFPTDPSFN